MTKLALSVGIDQYESEAFENLNFCEADAEAMYGLLSNHWSPPGTGNGPKNYNARLLTSGGKKRISTDYLRECVSTLMRHTMGDGEALFYFSGHGGRVRDVTGEEGDQKDDTWCLYDGQLLDDELNVMFAGFAAGVRILVVSDSCHSGTLLKGESDPQNETEIDDDFIIPRAMPRKAASDTYKSNRSFYTQIQDDLPVPRPAKSQTPGHMVVGREDPDFDRQPPFTI